MSDPGSMFNPFHRNKVTDAWDSAPVDVHEIHADALTTCLDAFEHVSGQKETISLLITGPAGAGKTHLLSRFQRYMTQTGGNGHPEGLLKCIFVSVPLHTEGQSVWRHVRRCFSDDLLRPLQGETSQLQRLVAFRMSIIDPQKRTPKDWLKWVRRQSSKETPNLKKNIEIMDRQSNIGLETCRVMRHYLTGKHTRDARAWLRGDPLPESSLRAMDLAVAPSANGIGEKAAEDKARQMVVSLSRLAGPRLPVVFCFDKVEAMQARPGDGDAMYRLGRVASFLLDNTPNLLLITSLRSSLLDPFLDFTRPSDREKMSRRTAVVDPLDRGQARRLIIRRSKISPGAGRGTNVSGREDWPIPFDELRDLFSMGTCPAGRVLMRCAEVFNRDKGHPLQAFYLEGALQNAFDTLQQAMSDPPAPEKTEDLFRSGLPLLAEIMQGPWQASSEPDGIEVVGSSSGTRYTLFPCNQVNPGSLSARLKGIVRKAGRAGYGRIVLLRDPRNAISPTAKKTLRLLHELEENRIPMVLPPIEILSQLNVLCEFINAVQDGRIELDGEPASVPDAMAWVAGNLGHPLWSVFDWLGESLPPAMIPPKTESPDLAEFRQAAEKTLLAIDPSVRVEPNPTLAGRYFRFAYQASAGVDSFRSPKAVGELTKKLGLETRPYFGQNHSGRYVDIPHPDPRFTRFGAIKDQLPKPAGSTWCLKIPIGVNQEDSLVMADLADPLQAHILAGGAPGSGKSEWLRQAAAGLLLANSPGRLRMVLIGPRGRTFTGIAQSPYIWAAPDRTGSGKRKPGEVLADLVAEMDRRLAVMNPLGLTDLEELIRKTGNPLPQIICLWDGFGAWQTSSPETRKAIESDMIRVCENGYTAGIHMVLAARHPIGETIHESIASHMPCRVAFRTESPDHSVFILGEPGAENLMGSGDLLLKDVGEPLRLQAPLITETERLEIYNKGKRKKR